MTLSGSALQSSPGTLIGPGVLLTEKEAAEYLSLKVSTLRAWRHRKKGPRFLRLGAAIRYSVNDLDAFVRASAIETIH